MLFLQYNLEYFLFSKIIYIENFSNYVILNKKISIDEISKPKEEAKLRKSITDKLSSLNKLSDLMDISADMDLDEQKIEEQMHRNFQKFSSKDRKRITNELKNIVENDRVSPQIRKICLVALSDRYKGILKHDKRNDYIAEFFKDKNLIFRAYAINLIVGIDMLGTIMEPYEDQLLELKSELVESFYRYMDYTGKSSYVGRIPIAILKENRNSSLVELIEKMKDEVKEAVYDGLNSEKPNVLRLAADLILKVYESEIVDKN